MESRWFRKYKSAKKFIPLTYVIIIVTVIVIINLNLFYITHAFNGDFIFFIQWNTSSMLVCISNVS